MRIVIHETRNGRGDLIASEVIHTERVSWNKVQIPDNPEAIDMIDYLSILGEDADLRNEGGYNEPAFIEGKPHIGTKWDAVMDAAASGADAELTSIFSK
jgi:hypothetical protein